MRKTIDGGTAMRLAKHAVNAVLNATKLGASLCVWARRPSSPG